jgi:hypothetical protein
MVNGGELLGTTEHLTQQARCRINRCRYNRVRLYIGVQADHHSFIILLLDDGKCLASCLCCFTS